MIGLFCHVTKGRVGRPRRRSARAGIEKRVHAHGFRHSHAANMATHGIALNVIQKQLGHANVATTSRYIDHVQDE